MKTLANRAFWLAVVFGSVFGAVAVVVFVAIFRLLDPEPIHDAAIYTVEADINRVYQARMFSRN